VSSRFDIGSSMPRADQDFLPFSATVPPIPLS
jgi:hypothetical protein